ncbi:MAG TPA: hypothetical protein PKM55_15770 [Acidobacteriota bacterium]|jgi:Tfp pilus assembly protein FimT|nr:hypothetical protein [Acidobacteriota bacterium]
MTHPKGFSTVEALVVIVIMGILVVVGVPVFTTVMADYRLNTALQAYSQAIQRGRYLASSQNALYVMELGTPGATGTPIVIFRDDNWDLACTLAGENATRVRFNITSEVQVTNLDYGRYTLPDGTVVNKNLIVFLPDGTLGIPTTLPNVDPWDPNTRSQKITMQSAGGFKTYVRVAGISRLGQIRTYETSS